MLILTGIEKQWTLQNCEFKALLSIFCILGSSLLLNGQLFSCQLKLILT